MLSKKVCMSVNWKKEVCKEKNACLLNGIKKLACPVNMKMKGRENKKVKRNLNGNCCRW